MIQSLLIKVLSAPFAIIYGFVIFIRNFFYDIGFLKSVSFNVPVIGIGNLSIGGTGKTPHVEYLIKLLEPYLSMAVLSRGYGRKTRGFKIADYTDTALSIGDEAYQYHIKYPKAIIAVSESRSVGIPLLLMRNSACQVILLDDSYQHRSVKPGLNMLLTEYQRPFFKDYLLPVGRLREWRSAYKRADIILVTKCPKNLTKVDASEFINGFSLLPYQKIFFSYYQYRLPYHLFLQHTIHLTEVNNIILFTGIADTAYLENYLKEFAANVYATAYGDHHYFSPHEISLLRLQLDNIPSDNKIILTTEKDATRLLLHKDFLIKHQLPIYILPVSVSFLFEEGAKFDDGIKHFLLNFTS